MNKNEEKIEIPDDSFVANEFNAAVLARLKDSNDAVINNFIWKFSLIDKTLSKYPIECFAGNIRVIYIRAKKQFCGFLRLNTTHRNNHLI